MSVIFSNGENVSDDKGSRSVSLMEWRQHAIARYYVPFFSETFCRQTLCATFTFKIEILNAELMTADLNTLRKRYHQADIIRGEQHTYDNVCGPSRCIRIYIVSANTELQ